MSNNRFDGNFHFFRVIRYGLLPTHLERHTQFSCLESSLSQLGAGGVFRTREPCGVFT